MTSDLAIERLRHAVDALPPDDLSPVRAAALERLSARGLPSTHDENFKYTDLSQIIDVSNQWLAAGAPDSSVDGLRASIASITGSIDAHWLVVANGVVTAASIGDFNADAIQLSQSSATSARPDQPLTDFNSVLLRTAVCLHVKGMPDKPVAVLFIDDPGPSTNCSRARIDMTVDPGCAMQFIELHSSQGSADHYANTLINVTLSDRAEADFLRIQQRQNGHDQTGRLNLVTGIDSRFRHAAFDFGGRLIRNDVQVDILQPGADVDFNGLYIASSGQHFDNHLRIDHRAGPARSLQAYRGILLGNSRCVWNGKTVVHAGADGTDARQSNHNLLLSPDAEIDTKPELEIYADDVKCNHGTTVGQIDEQALFYLRSRGVDESTAKQMLQMAFAAAIVERNPVKAASVVLETMLQNRLAELLPGATA